MKNTDSSSSLSQSLTYETLMDRYLPEEFRHFIEDSFYQKVSEQAKLENMQHDPDFYRNPTKHIALYTDHGVVHVQDVARQVLTVIERANGTLIPARDKHELEFLKAYTLSLAYLHDIGMADFTLSGRFMHPEFAAQFVFSPEFDPWLKLLWAKNAGNLAWTISYLFKDKYDEDGLQAIFREILSLSMGHSKSKMPIEILSNPSRLRTHMRRILARPLRLLFLEQKIQKIQKLQTNPAKTKKEKSNEKKIESLEKKHQAYLEQHEAQTNTAFLNKYQDAQKEAFAWLEMPEESIRRFVINIQDSIRCLRAADALRQRGTVLRTSAGYEIFVDRKTARAIYALRNEANDQLYLLETKKSVNAGEANLASGELDRAGNLRVSFHLGAFGKKKVINIAARNAASTIDDIQADTIQSFQRNQTLDEGIFSAPQVAFEEIKILVEKTEDNPDFAALVCQFYHKINPAESHRIQESFSLYGLNLVEVNRYLEGETLASYSKQGLFKQELLEKLGQVGYVFASDQAIPGEQDIRVIQVKAGEQLIEGGSSSGFVYFPLSDGIRVYPLGGYDSRPATAWVPLGNTGVIRGSIRNAHVYAEKPVRLLCIPRDIYLDDWYRPIPPKDLLKLWRTKEKAKP